MSYIIIIFIVGTCGLIAPVSGKWKKDSGNANQSLNLITPELMHIRNKKSIIGFLNNDVYEISTTCRIKTFWDADPFIHYHYETLQENQL